VIQSAQKRRTRRIDKNAPFIFLRKKQRHSIVSEALPAVEILARQILARQVVSQFGFLQYGDGNLIACS
jgi:hypothetical protein